MPSSHEARQTQNTHNNHRHHHRNHNQLQQQTHNGRPGSGLSLSVLGRIILFGIPLILLAFNFIFF